jgi:hypothetical protein
MCTTVLTATSIQVMRARSIGPGSSRSASRSNAVTTSI